uniref:Uncharacterized protein n=1 Tax=Sphingomonas sp. NS2 TaxID=908605 RepID=A0A0D4ZZA5_9SPHN|nr:hypothetical protein plasmid201_073 [Sphingomonas sp. NS2]
MRQSPRSAAPRFTPRYEGCEGPISRQIGDLSSRRTERQVPVA